MANKINITDLPEEMLVKIFTYLNIGDLFDAKVVCTRWLDIISTSRKLRKARKICLTDCLLSPNIPPISVLKRSPRQFEVLKIGGNVQILDGFNALDTWKNVAENIEKLTLECLTYAFTGGIHKQIKDIFGDKYMLSKLFKSLKVIYFKGHIEEYFDIKSVIEEFDCVSNNISIKLEAQNRPRIEKYLIQDYSTILKYVVGDADTELLELLMKTKNLRLLSLDTFVKKENADLFQKCIQHFHYVKKLKVSYCFVPNMIPMNATEVKFFLPDNMTLDDCKKVFILLKALPASCKKILSNTSIQNCIYFHKPLQPQIKFEMFRINCLECLEMILASGGIVSKLDYDVLNKDEKFITILKKQLKTVGVLDFDTGYLNEEETDDTLITILPELQNVKKINGRKFRSDVLLAWPKMRELKTFFGIFSNEPLPALEHFVFKCPAITELKLTITPFGGYSFPIAIFISNLPRLRQLTIDTTLEQMDAFVKNIPICNTGIQYITILDILTKLQSSRITTEVTTDIFLKIPSLKSFSIAGAYVNKIMYYKLLKNGVAKSTTNSFYELCDSSNAVGLKYNRFDWRNEYTRCKLIVPLDLKEELKKIEDEFFLK